MESGLAGRKHSMFLAGPFVHYQTREHDILKTNEPILMQSRPRSKDMKRSTSGVRRLRINSAVAWCRIVQT